MKKIVLTAFVLGFPLMGYAQSRNAKAYKRDTAFAELLKMPQLHSSSPYVIRGDYRQRRYYATPTDKQVDSVYQNVFDMQEVPVYWEDTRTHRTAPTR